MNAAIIATTARTPAERTKATPTTNPMANTALAGLFSLKLIVLAKPKQEPSPNRTPQTNVIRICFHVDLGGRGPSGAGWGGGVVKESPSASTQ
jgi:hypothetical protein